MGRRRLRPGESRDPDQKGTGFTRVPACAWTRDGEAEVGAWADICVGGGRVGAGPDLWLRTVATGHLKLPHSVSFKHQKFPLIGMKYETQRMPFVIIC